jgi:HEAT repeat protein
MRASIPSYSKSATIKALTIFAFFLLMQLFSGLVAAQTPDLELLRSGTSEEKRTILGKLRLTGQPEGLNSAIPALKDKDPVVRATAIPVVAKLGQKALPYLIDSLGDSSALVRKEAAYSIFEIYDDSAFEKLKAVLNKDPEMEVKVAAAYAIGGSSNPAASKPLLEVLSSKSTEENEFLQAMCSLSIGRIAQRLRGVNVSMAVPQSYLTNFAETKTLAGMFLKPAQIPEIQSVYNRLLSAYKKSGNWPEIRRNTAFALFALSPLKAQDDLKDCSSDEDLILRTICREGFAGKY